MLFLRAVNMAMVVMVGRPATNVIIMIMSWVIGSSGSAPGAAVSSAYRPSGKAIILATSPTYSS